VQRAAAGLLLGLALTAAGTSAWAGLTVSIGQVPAPSPIYPGEVADLRITLSNNSTAGPITGVAFSNSLPGTWPNGLRVSGAYSYTCTDPATGTTSAGVGTLTASDGTQAIALANGVVPARANNIDGTCEIILPVTAGTSTGAGANYNYGFGSGDVQGTDAIGPVANQGAVQQNIEVRPMARPSIGKSFSPGTLVLNGNSGQLTITVTNSNTAPIQGFSIQDSLPDNIVLASPAVASSVCNNGGSSRW
jgi:uncharacterized repeat protein (TIGR01451 family)